MRRSRRLLHIVGLGFAGLVLLPGASQAEISPATKAQSEAWDVLLNNTYQQGLRALPPAQQTALRNAQRAWLDFREKSRVAMIQMGSKRAFSEDQLSALDTYELAARCRQIERLLSPAPPTANVQAAYTVADASLNDVYKRLLATLDETDKKSLREAQRAWVKFRDAGTKLTATTFGDGRIDLFSILIIKHRVEQLQGVLAGKPALVPGTILADATSTVLQSADKPRLSTSPVTTPVISRTVETPDPSIPDPFSSAR